MNLLKVLEQYLKDPAAARTGPSLLPSPEELDRGDPLAHKRAEFALPEGVIYLDGNSLGPLPRTASERAMQVVSQQWGEDLITSWNKHAWIDLPQSVGEKIAPLLGAAPGQVICCDSISVNLFKLLAAALRLNPARRQILTQADNFPTDLYVVQGLQDLIGEDRAQLRTVEATEIANSLTEEVAVLLLTQVNFRSGHAHDIGELTQLAQSKGALVIWDLAHSAGVMPLELDRWNVDLAVGCGYKYLNGGPGAPAYVYVASRHQAALAQPLAGWMGHKSPFDFSPDYSPAPDIKRLLAGTPPVLSMSVMEAALDVFRDIDIDIVREKSLKLADYFAAKVVEIESLDTLGLITPMSHTDRGAQLSYSHPDAYAICQALISVGVIADFRAPDILRFGFSPLFLSFSDVHHAVERLERVLSEGLHKKPEFSHRRKVT